MATCLAARVMARVTPGWSLAALIVWTMFVVTWVAPADHAMGDAQRIVYVHVAVAWFALAAFVVTALTAFAAAWCRDLDWETWSHAAAEIGWLSCSLTLLTGSLWAHEAWGTWWTWDPRLTTAFLLWLVYSAMLLVRCYSTVDGCRAWRCAVLGAVGIADLPLVVMATQWFRGMHPASPELEPAMRLVLWATVGSFALFFARLLVMRQRQLGRRLAPQARRTVEQLEREVGRPVGRKADDERRSPWEIHVWDELPARGARRAERQRQAPGAASVSAR